MRCCSSDTYRWTKIGNTISGEATQNTNETSSYNMVEASSNGSISFTLTENGVNSYAQTETSDAVTGAYTTVQAGTDMVTFVETGSNAGGNFTETVSGTQSYTMTETGNSDTGTFTREETGSGSYNREDAGSGATLSNGTVPISYSDSETGDTLAGSLQLTETGTDPYGLLEGFNNVSNAVNGTPGNMDFSPFGKPFADPIPGTKYYWPWEKEASFSLSGSLVGDVATSAGLVNANDLASADQTLQTIGQNITQGATVAYDAVSQGATVAYNNVAEVASGYWQGAQSFAGSLIGLVQDEWQTAWERPVFYFFTRINPFSAVPYQLAQMAVGTYNNLMNLPQNLRNIANAWEQNPNWVIGQVGFQLHVAWATWIAGKIGKSCFPAGTLVATADGLRPIEEVRADEEVWAYDLVASEWRLCRVARPYSIPYQGTLVLTKVAGETIEATYRHPYWVVRGEELAARPWLRHLAEIPRDATTPGRWVDSCDLRVGDEVLLRDGRISPVESVERRLFEGPVYNMEVDDLHCYAVGRNSVLVHNNNGPQTGPVYEGSAKHGETARGTAKGISSPAPTNGQAALNNSIQVKPSSPRRVGIDPATGEIVVFDETTPGVFHGHVPGWDNLHPDMQRALIKAGMVTQKGKVK